MVETIRASQCRMAALIPVARHWLGMDALGGNEPTAPEFHHLAWKRDEHVQEF
jgi:hypothetical protein